MSLVSRGPSGLPQLAGYVVTKSFFRVHESVANEKKKKDVGSKTLLSSSAFPSRTAVSHSRWTMCTPRQKTPKTDLWKCQPTVHRHLKGRRWCQLTSQPSGLLG